MSRKNAKENGGTGPRTVALVGPYGSGKTTLLESILAITGATQRKGSVTQKNSVGDASLEARARQMSVEVNCATTKYLDDSFTFLDCPGSIEFLQETLNVLPGVDAAVVVCEPEPAKVQMLKPYLKRLEDLAIPHFLFVNKIDKSGGALRNLLGILQQASDTPLLLRQIPLGETVSYGSLAAQIGTPTGARAVASACANNRIAMLIPCHRVVGGDGRLAGYRWGVERKAALLEREAKASVSV